MYDRKGLMWQPRPTTALPGTAKNWTVETSEDPASGVWHAATVVGLASRNSRCGEFTDVTKLPPVTIGGTPGVPGKDGDCILLTYRMADADQYVKVTAVAIDGTKSAPSNTLYLPEPALGLGFWGLVVFCMLIIATDPNYPRRK